MSHANARLTVRGRMLIVERRRNGWKQAQIAAAMGVSRKCVRYRLARFATEGEPGLADRSSRPHRCPARTSPEVEAKVVAMCQTERRGRDQVATELGVPPRTVSRILTRHHMPHLALLDPMTGERLRASKTTAVRYEGDRPGELVHMDVKKLGRIPDGGGWRAIGRAAREKTQDRRNGVGYDYVHSLVDDHSRLAYSEILTDEKGPTCAGFLDRAIAYFAAHGITRIERLMTDDAWACRWSLRQICTERGIRQKFIKPHCPWQNGKVERLNRTLATEWAYRQVFNLERRTCRGPGTLDRALHHPTLPPSPWRTPTDQPAVTNVVAGYT